MSYLRTYTGRKFDPLHPRAEDIAIEDIAHALACMPRFAGHTHVPYSVAQHCVLMAEALADQPVPVSTRLWALLHDAAEAYICDLPAPLKRSGWLEGYGAVEALIMAAVVKRFLLGSEDEPAAVKRADAAMLRSEQRDLVLGATSWREGGECLVPPTIEPWPWWRAEIRFLECYSRLTMASYEMPRHIAERAEVTMRASDLKTLLLEVEQLREWRDAAMRRDSEAHRIRMEAAARDEFSTRPTALV